MYEEINSTSLYINNKEVPIIVDVDAYSEELHRIK